MAPKFWQRIPKWVYNRYVIVGAIFLAWMFFLDDNSFLFHKKLDRELEELQDVEQYYMDEIAKDKVLLHDLDSSDEALERIAREEYHMKKDNEDVYIIKEEKKDE